MSAPVIEPLPAQPWMTAASKLFAALGAPALDVRFVGGCVRNSLMGIAVADIDVGTPEPPPQVMARLERAGMKVVPTGIDHGTVTAVVDGRPYEITSLRRDTACDGRHAAVEFTTDWKEDAGRRDFTFNALSLRADGTLFDYHGGIGDAQAGRVRFVGNPADRIQEDYLRILRLFRFFAWYGRESLSEETLEACKEHAEGLSRLSVERIQQELAKTLAAPQPGAAIALMSQTGVLVRVLPEALGPERLVSLTSLESALAVRSDWLRRLAAVLPRDGSEAVAQRLKFSNIAGDRLRVLTAGAPHLDADTPPQEIRAALYRLGQDAVRDRLLLAWAAARTAADDGPKWRDCVAMVGAWQPRRLGITGADVLALGVPEGPQVGEIIRTVEDWWIAADFTPSREETLAQLRRIAGS